MTREENLVECSEKCGVWIQCCLPKKNYGSGKSFLCGFCSALKYDCIVGLNKQVEDLKIENENVKKELDELKKKYDEDFHSVAGDSGSNMIGGSGSNMIGGSGGSLNGDSEGQAAVDDPGKKSPPGDNGPRKVKQCRYYLNGKCRNSRTNCNFEHRRKCNQWLQNGTCTRQQSCKYAHPKICFAFLNAGNCSRTGCSFVHVKNCRERSENAAPGNGSGQSHFLDQRIDKLIDRLDRMMYQPVVSPSAPAPVGPRRWETVAGQPWTAVRYAPQSTV